MRVPGRICGGILAIAVFCWIGVCSSYGTAFAAEPAVDDRAWLLTSDIHFNPFDDPSLVDALVRAPASQWHAIIARGTSPPSGYFRDTNFALLESALAAMAADRQPPLVVIAGDFLAHDFEKTFARTAPGYSHDEYGRFVDKTIAFLALEFGAAFPHAQFIVTVGNNDGHCGDYRSTPQSPFLAHMAQAWEPLVDRDGSAPDFTRDFSRGGYYIAKLPGPTPQGEAVVLNSVFWSAKYENACGVATDDPGTAELDWLSAAVSTPPASYRWFVTHIPPGIDEYSSFRANAPVPFMQERYAQRLVALAGTPNARSRLFVFGHVHHASYYVIGRGDGGGVPGLVVPSISAVQGNNPAYVTADVDGGGAVTHTSAYVLPFGGAWQPEPSFDRSTPSAAFDAANLAALQAMLFADPAARTAYESYYNSQSSVAAIVPSTWPWYWCGNVYLTVAAYATCLTRTLPPAPVAR